MSRPPQKSPHPPTLHTAIIGDAGEMWSKLAWDADVYRDVQVGYPSEPQPLAYAALNVCISALSLRDWVETELARLTRAAGSKFDRKAHREAVRVSVPEQAMCEAIATTAKHAEHRDEKWPGGQVSLEWQDGDEDGPPGYMLRHRSGSGRDEDLAVNNFEALCSNWWTFLRSLGLAQDVERVPQWHQNKLRRIFGDPDDRILPPGCQPLE